MVDETADVELIAESPDIFKRSSAHSPWSSATMLGTTSSNTGREMDRFSTCKLTAHILIYFITNE